MPKQQSTAARRARETARQGGKYTQGLREATTVQTDDEWGPCEAEFIDGTWYGDDCPECREAVERSSDDCEACIEGEYCSLHDNGAW